MWILFVSEMVWLAIYYNNIIYIYIYIKYPRHSIYSVFPYIYPLNYPNVDKYSIHIGYYSAEAMAEALAAGARRRALVAVATPPHNGPTKRAFKKSSPLDVASVSTVTPEAKRHMQSSAAPTVLSASSGAGSDSSQPVEPMELFPPTNMVSYCDTLVPAEESVDDLGGLVL